MLTILYEQSSAGGKCLQYSMSFCVKLIVVPGCPQPFLSFDSMMTLQERELQILSPNMHGSVAEIPTNCLAICFQADKALKFLSCWMTKRMLLLLAAWAGITDRSAFLTQLDFLIAAVSLVPF